MTRYRHEYRINKNGAECFRTDDFGKARDRLAQLSENRPGVYTMQSRSVQLDRYGVAIRDCYGKPLWTTWQ